MDLKEEKVFQLCVKCAWGKGEMGSWKSAPSGIKLGGSSGQARMSLVAEDVEISVLALLQGSNPPCFSHLPPRVFLHMLQHETTPRSLPTLQLRKQIAL